MLSLYLIITLTFGNLATSQEAGVSARKLLSSGAGLPDSMLHVSIHHPYVLIIRCRHRILAELLEQGTRSTLTLPIHKPVTTTISPSQSQATLRTSAGVEYDAMRSLGLNPSHALQHPGFYYYMAARCTEMRRKRFLAALEGEVSI
jgi:hypothetical protein